VLNLEDPANRRVIEFFAGRDKRSEPLDEPAYYPPMERLTTHPDVLEQVWEKLGSRIPTECRRFVHGVACLVQDRSGIILAFGWGTAYALRLAPAEFGDALKGGASPATRWSGGSVTDLSIELGPDWLWGEYADSETGWVAVAYGAFSAASLGG
jgi:hypothetical protein